MDSPFPSSSSSWDAGKLFVGGISWDTGSPDLHDHFSKYGDVTEAVAVKDRATGNPRGFAFVLFSDPAAVERALADDTSHVILGRTVEVKRARPRTMQQHQPQTQNQNKGISKIHARSKKIFVGGLPSDATSEAFRAYFEKFGSVIDVVVIYDNNTHRSRGFGFVEFEKEESVEEVMRKDSHELNGKVVEVKIAVPKDGYNHRNSGKSNSSKYNSASGDPVGYSYQGGGLYPSYNPRYGYPYVYPPPGVAGYTYGMPGYGGGYGFGGGYRLGYGPPVPGPRGVIRSPMLYGGPNMYPAYPPNNGFGGGYISMPNGVYHGVASNNDKGNQSGSDAQATSDSDAITLQVEDLKLDAR